MPKIAAPSVVEHREIQKEAILEAAGRLFAERGVTAIEMGEIAAEVGLSRTAIYRYFPDRERIFIAWADRILSQVVDELDEVLRLEPDPLDRLDAWIEYMLEHAAGPDHAVGRRVEAEIGALPIELRDKIREAHEVVQLRILDTVVELVGPERDALVLARMTGAAVQAAAASGAGQGASAYLKSQVIEAVHRLLGLAE